MHEYKIQSQISQGFMQEYVNFIYNLKIEKYN